MADALFDRALELVMDAGQTLLENGGEVFRAQQTMEIIPWPFPPFVSASYSVA